MHMRVFLIRQFLAICCLTMILSAQSWEHITIGDGVKPSMAIATDDAIHISYMLESLTGWVNHATLTPPATAFSVDTADTGYFYGPLSVALDASNLPHINYHDHDTEDQMRAYQTNGVWQVEQIVSTGHDGWDNSILVNSNGDIHTSTVDPAQFAGPGLEYSVYDGNSWTVELVPSGSIEYANATSLALDSQGNPHITYFDHVGRTLKHATKSGGNWTVETVDSIEAGQFSSIAIDGSDNLHISYYQNILDSTGIVKYAFYDGNAWTLSFVDSLHYVYRAFDGARNMTSIKLNSLDEPLISYSDEKLLKLAEQNESSWDVETILDEQQTSVIFGQMTSLVLDSSDEPHIAYWEVATKTPLTGTVKYARRAVLTDIADESAAIADFHLEQNYPNPFNPATQIPFQLNRSARVMLEIYDIVGRRIETLVDRKLAAGQYQLQWDGVDEQGQVVSAGIYFYRLSLDNVVRATRRMVFLK